MLEVFRFLFPSSQDFLNLDSGFLWQSGERVGFFYYFCFFSGGFAFGCSRLFLDYDFRRSFNLFLRLLRGSFYFDGSGVFTFEVLLGKVPRFSCLFVGQSVTVNFCCFRAQVLILL